MIYGDSPSKKVAQKNQIHGHQSKLTLSYDLDYSFSKLLSMELEIARCAEFYYRDLKYSSDFNISTLFNIIDSDYRNGYIEGRR